VAAPFHVCGKRALAQFDIKSIQHTGNAAPSSQMDNFLDTRLSLATQQHSTDEPSALHRLDAPVLPHTGNEIAASLTSIIHSE
jgi:hypothetical protein